MKRGGAGGHGGESEFTGQSHSTAGRVFTRRQRMFKTCFWGMGKAMTSCPDLRNNNNDNYDDGVLTAAISGETFLYTKLCAKHFIYLILI